MYVRRPRTHSSSILRFSTRMSNGRNRTYLCLGRRRAEVDDGLASCICPRSVGCVKRMYHILADERKPFLPTGNTSRSTVRRERAFFVRFLRALTLSLPLPLGRRACFSFRRVFAVGRRVQELRATAHARGLACLRARVALRCICTYDRGGL